MGRFMEHQKQSPTGEPYRTTVDGFDVHYFEELKGMRIPLVLQNTSHNSDTLGVRALARFFRSDGEPHNENQQHGVQQVYSFPRTSPLQ